MKRALLGLLACTLVAAAPPEASAPTSAYEQAVAARQAGDNGRAISLLRQVVATEPANADAHLQLGLALLAAGDLKAAEASFRRTLEIAPAYEDARIGLARVAQRRGDLSAARTLLGPVNPANRDAADLRASLEASDTAGYRWQLNLDGSYSALEGDAQPDWREGVAQLRYQLDAGTALGATVEVSRRFGRTDTYGELRLDRRLAGGNGFYLLAGATPGADFRPEWQIGGGGTLRLRGGANPTALTIDARQARFQSGNIQTVTPGVEQYLAGGRAWATARWINIFDENGTRRSGWLGRGDYMATERLRLFAGIADAPDVSEGVVVDTFSLFGGLSYDVDDRRTLRLSLAHEDREQGSDRLQIGLGLGWRF
ncbi:MAG TPA: YaiO family outer membrane beta-barrel protein [Allosphingosinicella sp.]